MQTISKVCLCIFLYSELNIHLQQSHLNVLSQNCPHNISICKCKYVVSMILQISVQSGTRAASNL